MISVGLRRVADALLAAVLAPTCAACAHPLDSSFDGPVCAACWGSIAPPQPPLCRLCGASLPSWRTISTALSRCVECRRYRTTIASGASAGEYANALRAIVHAFKYDRRRSLAAPLAARMRDAGAAVLDGADCVIPVPLHPWRRLERGFNQASDLADGLGLPVVHALRRRRSTPPQSGLRAASRRRNVRDAFTLSWRLSDATRRRRLTGRVVVLVDDVRTTGATLDACARVLASTGVREVRALTLAHAPIRPGPVEGASRRRRGAARTGGRP